MAEGQATATKSGAPDPLIGRVIADRFKIASLIARGGMGKVYLAEQAPLGRLCAVKVLNPNYDGDADPEFHRRFFREASITSKITHPNCITLFDYGKTDDDIYYMAMEYLEGQTLHMAIREGGVMHEVRAGRIAMQICRALREAHKLGVIHRDLKPANVFLTRPNAPPSPDASGSMAPLSEDDEDFVKVLDFGLVKHLSERPEEQLTQTGLFMGSPKYMAPEQIQGGHVDARTDIYSLGIIMYEMLAGKVPFERATSVNILMAHVGEPPPPMRAVNPNLVCSPAFEELVMRCIAKDPNERMASMDEVIAAIRRAHGGSMTGQLPAVGMSSSYPPPPTTGQLVSYPPPPTTGQLVDMMSGSYAPVMPSVSDLGSVPPPPNVSSGPGAIVAPSGSLVPTDISGSESSDDASTAFAEAKPRSKMWVLLGVVFAALFGGGLGMLAFHWSAPEPTASSPPAGSLPLPASSEGAEPSSSGAEGANVETPSAASLAPAAAKTSGFVRVTTDPPGAAVRDVRGVELCAATPCDVESSGETRKIVLSRVGYRSETRLVKASDAPVHVRLARVMAPSRPSADPSPDPTTPSGFKDQPY